MQELLDSLEYKEYDDMDDFSKDFIISDLEFWQLIQKNDQQQVEILFKNLLTTIFELKKIEKEFRQQLDKARLKRHEDDDGFDYYAESYEHHSSFMKNKIKTIKNQLVDIVYQRPKTNALDHDSSDCESCCETCSEKKIKLQALSRKVFANPMIKQFVDLLEQIPFGHKLTIPAYPIQIMQYLEGYSMDENLITLQFIKTHTKLGVLHNKNKTIYWIYHDGTLNDYPKLCPYFLPKCATEDIVVTDDANNIKILLKDDVFEDYVHHANGFLIPNQNIQLHLKQ